MKFANSVRALVGILLIVFFSLLSNYQLFVKWVSSDLRFVGRDATTLNEQRFDLIKERLPSHGVVGYYPNGRPATLEQLTFGNPADLQNWLLTQYTLAPVIVSPTLGHSVIVSNFPGIVGPPRNPTMRETVAGRKEFDFGNGVKLIKRELE